MLSANFLFYFFSGVLIFSAIMVIVAQHSVFSLLQDQFSINMCIDLIFFNLELCQELLFQFRRELGFF